MVFDNSRVMAIVGHYGSGKTEIALNIALSMQKSGRRARVVDMDIVNPFFRSAECAEKMRALGVEVLYPEFALSAVDMPTLGAEVRRAFEDDGCISILDIGGDDAGAAALGGFANQLNALGAEMYYVINPYRPRSRDIEQIKTMFSLIEARSRMKVSGIIANPNMGRETTPEIIRDGEPLIAEVAEKLGVPVIAECVREDIAEGFAGGWDVFPIQRFLVPEWMDEE